MLNEQQQVIVQEENRSDLISQFPQIPVEEIRGIYTRSGKDKHKSEQQLRALMFLKTLPDVKNPISLRKMLLRIKNEDQETG